MIRKTGIAIAGILLFMGTACDFMEKTEEREIVARVNDSYLYADDISALVTDVTSPEDSAMIVSNYITRWATQKLLIDRAKVNISTEKQEEFQKLVENYRNELFAKAYTDIIVAKQLDTNITAAAAKDYYEKNGKNFKLNEDLVKLRYININKNNSNLEEIKTLFRRFDEEDRQKLMDMAIQFNSYSLNDSVWVQAFQVYEKIKPLNPDNNSELLKKENFFQLQDSLEVYLVSVEDVKLRNEQAPLDYSLPTIEQIILNQRKLELIKELEKDITQDAIKNEEFEIYN